MVVFQKLFSELTRLTGGPLSRGVQQVLAARLAGMAFSYLAMYLVLNRGTAEDWGWLTLTIAVINIVGVATTYGLHTLMLKRFPVNTPADNGRDAAVVFQVVLGLSAIAILVLLPFREVLANKLFKVEALPLCVFSILLLMIPVFNLRLIILSVFKLNRQMALFGLFFGNYLFYAVLALVAVFMVWRDGTVDTGAVFHTFVIVSFLSLLIAAVLGLRKLEGWLPGNFFRRYSGIHYVRLLKEATPLVLISSLAMVMSWSDSLLIGVFMTPEDVGHYNVIFKVANLATLFLWAVNSVITPRMSALYKNDREALGRLVRRANRYVFIVTSVVVLGMLAFPKAILGLFGGGLEFLVVPLWVLVAGYFVSALCGTVGFLLQMTGHARVFQRIVLAAAIGNIVLNIILIPLFGLLGAAIASTTAMVFWNLAAARYVNKRVGIRTWQF